MTRRTFWLTSGSAAAANMKARAITIDLRTGGPYVFPPTGKAYRENGPSHRVWRRVFIEAPDRIFVPGDQDYGLRATIPPGLRAEQDRRLAMPPREWMAQLAGQYGQELREMVYTLSFSVWGRLRAGQLAQVKPVLEPFLDGRIDSLAKPTASHYSGHLTLAALYEFTNDARARDRVIAAARMARDNPMHNEMSDAVFMVCPLLTKAGKYTGDAAYFDAMNRHLETMKKLCLRADGLYRHSPLDEAAWGRGNAFPMLGLALTLTDLPASHAAFAPIAEAYRDHAAKLLTMQTSGGCWRQIIDKEDAWEEFTCTAMIGWAMRRGLTKGWLRGTPYEQAVARAWQAIQRRTLADGRLIDVCESTGKQKTITDYYNREAIFGKDPRGGAMALQFAAEMAGA